MHRYTYIGLHHNNRKYICTIFFHIKKIILIKATFKTGTQHLISLKTISNILSN